MLPSVISGNFIDAKDRSMFVLSSDFLSLAFMNVVILVLLCPIPATWSNLIREFHVLTSEMGCSITCV